MQHSTQKLSAEFELDPLKSRAGVNIFLEKTYNLLQENKYPEIFSWSVEGDSMIIQDIVLFQEKILITAFGHSNFNSFVRQLNMYNFRKRKAEGTECAYFHQHFLRGRKDLLERISRKKVKRKLKPVDETERQLIIDEEAAQLDTPRKQLHASESMVNEITELRMENKTTQEMLETLKYEFCFLKDEYMKLNRDHIELRQRFNRQMIAESDLLQKYHLLRSSHKPSFMSSNAQDWQIGKNIPIATGPHISRQLNPELAWKMGNCNLSEFHVATEGYPNNLSGVPDEMLMRQLNQTTFGDFDTQNRFA